jgi:hypothetical protein
MENKAKKVNLRWIEWVVEFYQEREELHNEKVQSITYKEDDDEKYTFHNKTLTLTPFTSNISSFETISKGEFEGEEVKVRKTYVYDEDELEFVVSSKYISF